MTRSIQPTPEARADNAATMDTSVLCLAVVPKAGFLNHKGVASFPLYWLNADIPPSGSMTDFVSETELGTALQEILADGLLEELWYARPNERGNWAKNWAKQG